MGKARDSQIDGKYNYRNEKINYYNSTNLDYYKSDTFKKPDNCLDTYHIQNSKKYRCQYYGSQFLSNSKLYNHL